MEPLAARMRKRWWFFSSEFRRISLNIFDTSAVMPMLSLLNRVSTSGRGGYKFGPGRSVSLSENELDERAEASKTALTFVVVEESLNTPCTGR